jgi:excisionase family DNA binding protein
VTIDNHSIKAQYGHMNRKLSTEPKLLYRVSAAANRLDVSRSQMYNLINSGQVQAVRVGASIRVPARELERLAGQPAA